MESFFVERRHSRFGPLDQLLMSSIPTFGELPFLATAIVDNANPEVLQEELERKYGGYSAFSLTEMELLVLGDESTPTVAYVSGIMTKEAVSWTVPWANDFNPTKLLNLRAFNEPENFSAGISDYSAPETYQSLEPVG